MHLSLLKLKEYPKCYRNADSNCFFFFKIDIESGKQWKYSQLQKCVEKCSSWLTYIGATAGSHVALITSSTVQTILMQLACASIGALIICIDGYLSIGR